MRNKWKPKLLTEKHLETLRSLTQFTRCWHIIDSHLILYNQHAELKKNLDLPEKPDMLEG